MNTNRKCTGRKANGDPCGNYALRGATVCRKHGGAAPQVAARAAVRAEVMSWGLGDTTIDPGEVLLRLVSQSAVRAERYAQELEELVGESKTLRDALVAQAYGEFGPVGEYVRGLATLEAQERDRCAGFAAKAIAAGLNERMVRLAEKQASIAERALVAALADIGLSADQQRQATARLVHHLRLAG